MSNETTVSSRLKRARVLAVISLILAVLGILFWGMVTQFSVEKISLSADQPNLFYEQYPNASEAMAQMLVGADVSREVTGIIYFAVISLFAILMTLMNIVPLLASISIIRAPRRPNIKRGPYVFGVIGSILSFLSFGYIKGTLLAVAAANVHHDYVDTVGEETAYKSGKKLGLMRFMEALFVLDLVGTITVIIFLARSNYGYYDASYWVSFIKIIMESVAIWFMWNRKQHGREVIMAMTGGYVVLYLIVGLITSSGVMSFNVFLSLFDPIIIFLYFTFARRPRAIFTEPFHSINRAEQLEEEERLWNPRSWRFWRNLLLYFCVFSVIGHWMEWCVCWTIRIAVEHGITWLGTYDPKSGIWHNMLNPFFVYGGAMVLIGLLLYPARNFLKKKFSDGWKSLVLSFLLNLIVVAALELAVGFLLNNPPDPVTGKLPLWDYTTMPFNFMGQICLLNTVFFAVMATVCTNLVYPNLEKVVAKIPDDVMNIITVAVLVFFFFVVIMYAIPVYQLLGLS